MPGFQQLSTSAGAGGTSSSTTATTATSSTSGGGQEPALGPPYPIVLAHGFFGFEEFAGLDSLTYYSEVRGGLAAHRETHVFTPAVDPFNSSAYRGAQLAEEVDAVLAYTGHEKVILIGHSQGGLDARVVAHEHPDKVAAVITLQTPHYGSPISDVALGLIENEYLAEILDFLTQAVGQPLHDEIGNESSLAKALYQFSQPAVEEFNATYLDQPGIYYASIAGRSDLHDGGDHCIAPNAPPFIAMHDEERDPIDPLFDISEMVLDGGWGDPYPNDGLVRAVDAQWGEFLGCVPADHMDMVGQLFGDSPGWGNDWDYRAFYVDLVAFLRAKGL